MVINAPPEFYKVLEKFSEAKDPEEKLKILKELLKVAPKHKSAQKLLLWIKKEIKKYKELLKKEKKKGKKVGIRKVGDCLVCLIGVQNSGKTYILNKLTNSKFKSTEVPFETVEPVYGILNYKGAKIQIVEIPSNFKKEYTSILRSSDLIIGIIDLDQDLRYQEEYIKSVLDESKIVINRNLPSIKIKKIYTNEVIVNNSHLIENFDIEKIRVIGLKGYEITVTEKTDIENVILVLKGYISKRGILFINKKDSIEELPEKIWKNLNLIRVFTKEKDKISEEPLILKANSKVQDAIEKINKKWIKTFKYAIIIRNNRRIRAGLNYILQDGDIIEIKC